MKGRGEYKAIEGAQRPDNTAWDELETLLAEFEDLFREPHRLPCHPKGNRTMQSD